ncbi:hypothetical protein [Paraburkholderia kirstenboschensis]|uniref:DUF5666 domain-containing protein n=1 Tax=Paraburkholderia kirstenboschensis TaxID=1245436 RepID=A0ABZ0EG63_9BURK|nr:hypothetical protein [Paraburkholderia kirstenboschensis]WOD15474.1 hypothetical protein RW095_19495 [Paraburkholderia kirstenboschensis]
MSMHRKLCVFLATLTLTCVSFAQTSDVKRERIRGDIVSLRGDVLTVHRQSGDTVSIEIKRDVAVTALKAVKLSDVKVGSYVGTPAIAGPDGKLTATSVLLFPEAARGTQEGHFAYDFGPNSTMTNANVDSLVTAASGRELQLSYKGGSNTVTVPENVPVVTFAPATRADLTSGKKVIVVVTPDQQGVFEAHVVLIEKDGVVPAL